MYKLGAKGTNELLEQSKEVILKTINNHRGVAADSLTNKFIATFESSSQAYLCALDIKNNLSTNYNNLKMKMAIHAGNPVDGDPELFGSALKFSSFMCNELNGTPMNVSNTVKELMLASGIKIEDSRITCLSKSEEDFLKNLIKSLYSNWQNPEFDIDDLCKALLISKSQLYRNCLGIMSKPSNKLLRDLRLEQVRQMLESTTKNISQTAYDCGFNSPSYFTKCFQSRYGIKPMEYKDIVAE